MERNLPNLIFLNGKDGFGKPPKTDSANLRGAPFVYGFLFQASLRRFEVIHGSQTARFLMPLDGVVKAFEAADGANLIGWQRWVSKEDRLSQTHRPSYATFANRELLDYHMSTKSLYPDPCYAPAPNLQKGRSCNEWACFAGLKGNSDPITGYSSRWTEARSRRPAPFLHLRQGSCSKQAFAAHRPLDVKPVDRTVLEAKLRKPEPPPVVVPHVMSMPELAPVRNEKMGRRMNSLGLDANDSTIHEIAFNYN